MTQFNEREQAFESKFGHDEELEFKITARAAKLFGKWAADRMGLKGQEASSYAENICDLSITPLHHHIVEKVEGDLQSNGAAISRHLLQKEMIRCENEARRSF